MREGDKYIKIKGDIYDDLIYWMRYEEEFTKAERRQWNKAYLVDRMRRWYPKDFKERHAGVRNVLRGWKERGSRNCLIE